MLMAQGIFSMLVMVEIADQTALWCARGQRMMATLVRMFMYFKHAVISHWCTPCATHSLQGSPSDSQTDEESHLQREQNLVTVADMCAANLHAVSWLGDYIHDFCGHIGTLVCIILATINIFTRVYW